MESKKNLVTKVVGHGKMHIHAKKWGQNSKAFFENLHKPWSIG
jgi:hypothetical protein